MDAQPGRLQAAFTAGEIDELLYERTELKYFNTGARRMENVVVHPQGGFSVRDGLRDAGALDADAARLFAFNASDGTAYDIVMRPGEAAAWSATAELQAFAVSGLTEAMLAEMTVAQRRDTMLVFHENLQSKRIKHAGPTSWTVDNVPWANLSNFDYGGPVGGGSYSNGVPAEWQLEFVGLVTAATTNADRFSLTVASETTSTIAYLDDMATLAPIVEAALEGLPGVSDLAVTVPAGKERTLRVTFNTADAAVDMSGTGYAQSIFFPGGDRTVLAVNIQDYDAGNPDPEIWDIEFIGFYAATTTGGTGFKLTVARQDTYAINYSTNMTVLGADIETAIEDLPNVSPGITVSSPTPGKIDIEFTGDGNEGDGWAVSGQVINKPDAAVLAYKTTVGVTPGEPVISADRGWPQCGAFYAQRLLTGGFKSLPNAWLFSTQADYFNFDERFDEANGPALVPMDVAGGERIEAIVPSLNLLIFTSKAEYWLAERSLARTQAPNHVQASRNGTKRGVPVVENEGAGLYIHANGSVLGEFRYTDVEGNYVSRDISLLASHLLRNVVDMAVRKSRISTDGNHLSLINGDGSARLATILREQDVTAFTRETSPGGDFKAVTVNGRNETGFIVERPAGRRLERHEDGLLLDEAVDFAFDPASDTLTGLSRFNGREVWVIGDGHVLGPFTVSGGTCTLPIAVSAATCGTWAPPVVETLPPPRTVAPNLVLKRKGRIHTAKIQVVDTTSIAIAANGGPLRDVDLVRFGATADVAELNQGYTGLVTVPGLRGYRDEPTLTISQVRPGRLTVRSVTIEAAL